MAEVLMHGHLTKVITTLDDGTRITECVSQGRHETEVVHPDGSRDVCVTLDDRISARDVLG